MSAYRQPPLHLAKINAIAKKLLAQEGQVFGSDQKSLAFRDSLKERYDIQAQYLLQTGAITEDQTVEFYSDKAFKKLAATITPGQRALSLKYEKSRPEVIEEYNARLSETGAVDARALPLVKSEPTPPSPAVASVASEVGSVGAGAAVVAKAPEPASENVLSKYPPYLPVRTQPVLGKLYKMIDYNGYHLYDLETDEFVGTVSRIGGLHIDKTASPPTLLDEDDEEDIREGIVSEAGAIAKVKLYLREKTEQVLEKVKAEKEKKAKEEAVRVKKREEDEAAKATQIKEEKASMKEIGAKFKETAKPQPDLTLPGDSEKYKESGILKLLGIEGKFLTTPKRMDDQPFWSAETGKFVGYLLSRDAGYVFVRL